MMRKATLLASLLLAAVLASVPAARAQADPRAEALEQYMRTLKTDILSRRDATLMAIVKLDGDAQKEFSSLKAAYDKELLKQAKARMKLLREFMTMHKDISADQAKDISSRYFEQETARQGLHERYFKMMFEKISPVVAVQFLQVQGQFETMAAMERAKYVPLAGE